MARIETGDLVSISEASKMGISALIHHAEEGHEQVVLRNNKPVAVVLSMDRFEQLTQLEDDLIDVTLGAARMMTASPNRYSLDDVLQRFGMTREQLRDLSI